MSETREELEVKKMKLEILKIEKEIGKIDFDIEDKDLLRVIENLKLIVTVATAFALGIYFIFNVFGEIKSSLNSMVFIWAIGVVFIAFFLSSFAYTAEGRKKNSEKRREDMRTLGDLIAALLLIFIFLPKIM